MPEQLLCRADKDDLEAKQKLDQEEYERLYAECEQAHLAFEISLRKAIVKAGRSEVGEIVIISRFAGQRYYAAFMENRTPKNNPILQLAVQDFKHWKERLDSFVKD